MCLGSKRRRTEEGPSTSTSDVVPVCCSWRLMVGFGIFISAILNVYNRVNLHLAILCFTANVSPDQENTTQVLSVLKTVDGVKIFYIPKYIRGHMLALYFYGLVVTMVIGGFISDQFGPRKPLLIGSFIQTVCTFITPILLNVHPYLFFPNRIIQGFSAGFSSTPLYQLFLRWALPKERAAMIGFSYTGYPLAIITIFPITGLMCQFGYKKWESAFYLPGIMGVIGWIFFYFFIHDSPKTCPYISEKERLYLVNNIPEHVKRRGTPIPWKSILSSMPVHAFIVAHIAQVFNWQTMSINMPAFYKEVLDFDLDQNSFVSSLPFVGLLLVRMLLAIFFEMVHKCCGLSITRYRKNNHIVGTIFPAVALTAITFLSPKDRYMSVILLTVGQGMTDLAGTGGYYPTFLDMAPSYSGLLLGIADSIAFTGSIVSALVVGYTTREATRAEWNYIMYTQVALLLLSLIFYEIFGSCELQPWATPGGVPSQEMDLKRYHSRISDLRTKM